MTKDRFEYATIKTTVSWRRHDLNVGALVVAGALGVAFLGLAQSARAADYYVSPSGNDSAAGTENAPWQSLSKAAGTASAGDTVYFREGSYPVPSQVRLSRSGTSDDNRIRFFAYEGEQATVDCSTYRTADAARDTPCVLVTGSYLHFRGLEFIGAPVGPSGAHSISTLRSNDGSNNTYELLDLHSGFGPGLFIDGGTGGNLILNCDSHDNYDKNGSQGDGQNGDGFGVHYQETGPSTIIRGCRAWLNSDDGYDLISQEVSVTIEDSWAFKNGYADGGSTSPSSGNGNGFKVGSSKTGIRHYVHRNVSWENKASGFYANHSSGGNTWFNNTSFHNGTQYNMLASTWDSGGNRTDGVILTGDRAHIMRNNVGFPDKNSNMGGVVTDHNTWDLGIGENNAFLSTSTEGVTGPREPDGGMPNLEFLKPQAGSVLIDRGTDVTLPYVGSAPDLGAYEYGASTGGGTGGAAGTAGTGGAAGGAGSGGAGGSGGTGVAGGMAGSGVTAGGTSSAGSGGAGLVGGSSVGGGGGSPTAGGPGSAGTVAVASGGTTGGTTGGIGTSTGGVATSTGGVATSTGGVATSTGGVATSTGGVATSTGGVLTVGGTSAVAGGDATGPSGSDGDASGCSCSLPSRSGSGLPIQWLAASALGLVAWSRRLGRRRQQQARR